MPPRLLSELLGTAFLLATVIGSGVMAENLSAGNNGVALLANALATGAILYVLITLLGPVSGAHFNPIVTLAFLVRREIAAREAGLFVLCQVAGGLLGMLIAHTMFELPLFQASTTIRAGTAQGISEIVASFGLVLVILVGIRNAPAHVPILVALYITAAYWFTASTSFANPAVTIARMFTDTFAGIRPLDAPLFMVAQLFGAWGAWVLAPKLFTPKA